MNKEYSYFGISILQLGFQKYTRGTKLGLFLTKTYSQAWKQSR